MKKKFLSLMMAAAVVATTSVSAFAADSENVINGSENETHESKIGITGDVLSDGGASVPGTLNVTVPTTASFTVNQSGVFSAAKIKIKNSGTQNVQVFAYEFVDINGASEGINVRKKSEITSTASQASQARNNIALKIYGDEGIAYLSSDSTKKGIYKDPELSQAAQDDDDIKNEGIKLTTINTSRTGELTLYGEAGSGGLNKPVRDEFTLKLKIKKA